MKHFVRYKARTPASLISREEEQKDPKQYFKLDYPNFSAAIYNQFIITEDGDHIHSGLGFDFIVEEESLEEAKNTAGDVADDLASLIAYATNTEISHPQQKQAYEMDKSSEENKFEQKLGNSLYPVATTLEVIDKQFLNKVFDLIYDADKSKSTKRKLMRGLYYFRRSLEAERKDDEFIRLYIALDSVEYLLRDIYGEEYKQFTCEECEGTAAEKLDQQSGRKGLYENSKYLDSNFGDISDARNQLFHAGKSEEAHEHIEELRKGFRIAIAKLMGIDVDKNKEHLLGDKRTTLWREEYIFDGVIKHLQSTKIQDVMQKPGIRPELNISYDIDENYNLNTVFDYHLEKYTPKDEQIIGDGIGHYYYGKIGDMVLKEHNQEIE